MSRVCTNCRKAKPLEFFSRDNSSPSGHATWCKECVGLAGKKHYLKDLRATLFRSAKANAKVRGIEFTIELSDLPDLPTHCPVLGLPLQVGSKGRSDNSPSLDRIDNAKGYVPRNLVIVSWRANRLKGSATVDELQKLAAFYTKEIK